MVYTSYFSCISMVSINLDSGCVVSDFYVNMKLLLTKNRMVCIYVYKFKQFELNILNSNLKSQKMS